MARVRNKDTAPEIALRKAVWETGLRYRLHMRLPGTPDFSFPRERVAVFIDGCFWHGCPRHYTKPARNAQFWAEKLKRNTARDRRVDNELRKLGWLVLRVWEHEAQENLPGAVAKVRRAVLRRRNSSR